MNLIPIKKDILRYPARLFTMGSRLESKRASTNRVESTCKMIFLQAENHFVLYLLVFSRELEVSIKSFVKRKPKRFCIYSCSSSVLDTT